MTTEFLVTFIVLAVGAALTYLIQYESVISPGYIEFDDRSIKEMKLMEIYNRVMEGSFKFYIMLICMAAFMSYAFGSIIFITVGLYIQVSYFSAAVLLMIFIYGRSRIYWKRMDKYKIHL